MCGLPVALKQTNTPALYNCGSFSGHMLQLQCLFVLLSVSVVLSLTGFLEENQTESRDNEKEYELGSRDLIGDGLTPPDTEMNSGEDGE